MKKLLVMLTTITSLSSITPIVLANAPISVKIQENKIVNNEINYLKTNNLETLNRSKRSWNDSLNENKINKQSYWDAPTDYWLWISRDNWIKTQKIYKESNNDYNKFKNNFFNIIKTFWREDRCSENELWKIVNVVWKEFSIINNKYVSSRVNYGLHMKIYKGERLGGGSNDLQLQCWNNCQNNWYKEKIKFLGIANSYRGEIGLDVDSKKILFFGENTWFHEYFVNKNYKKVIIKNQSDQIIKEIIIYGNESMQKIINDYNLQNGINYDYGYIIEVWSAEPSRTYFVMNEHNDYRYYVDTNPRLDKFIIINDKLLTFNFYKEEHFSLLLNWQENFTKWKSEIERQNKEDVPSFTIEQKRTWKGDKKNELRDKILSLKQNLQIIENSENINKLKFKIQKLRNDFNILKSKVDELYNKVEEISNSSNSGSSWCSNTFGLISPISSLIPVIGTATSAITGIIAAGCTIANK